MKNLIFAAIVVALGGLLSGYDTGVISGALLYIRDEWSLNEITSGYLVSILLVGAAIGALSNGVLADIFGRKKIIMATALIFFAGSIVCALAPDIKVLIISRFFIGVAIGVVTFAVPLYLSEISPEKWRGSLVSLFQLATTAGILFSYLTNALCANLPHNWRIMLFIGIVPALVLVLGMLKMPDTPRWFVLKGRYDDAVKAFSKIQPDIDANAAIKKIAEAMGPKEKIKFQKWMLYPVFLGIGVMFVQQWTGINTIIYYAPTILKLAGFSTNSSAVYATIAIGVVNFLMTFVAIAYCDKCGRKPLLYIGLCGMGISLFALGFAFLASLKWAALLSAIVYIMSFSFSLGPIMILVVSEIYPLSVRGLGMSIAMMSNFVFNFSVSISFLPMLSKFGEPKTFWFFGIICLLSLIFCRFFLPETKGATLEEIEMRWK